MKKLKISGFILGENIIQELFKNTYCCWRDGEVQVITSELLSEEQNIVGRLLA